MFVLYARLYVRLRVADQRIELVCIDAACVYNQHFIGGGLNNVTSVCQYSLLCMHSLACSILHVGSIMASVHL